MKRDDEVAVAEAVERVLRTAGRLLGPRTRHDGRIDPNLTVDFTYEHASPTVAMEITGLYRAEDLAALTPADRLSERLSAVASAEQLGGWFIAVRTDARLDTLDAAVLPIMRDMAKYRQKELRPGSYTWQDLDRANQAWGRHGAKRFVAAHERAKAQGIVQLTRTDDPENAVGVVPLSGTVEIVGFGSQLFRAIEENRTKLGRTRPRETHLAVSVNRFDASRFVSATPVPSLPIELDVLWVLHGYHGHLDLPGIWTARRGDSDWTLHEDPGDTTQTDDVRLNPHVGVRAALEATIGDRWSGLFQPNATLEGQLDSHQRVLLLSHDGHERPSLLAPDTGIH